jgi:perosamine synthetase
MIPVCEPEIGEEELENAVDAITSGFISGTIGEYLTQFEDQFANYCGVEHGVATTSGTTALHLALESIDLGEGAEVLVPDITNAATAFAPVYANAIPVAVDCDPETWCMDPDNAKDQITPRTKAIIPVHLYGHPVDMDPILDLAREHDLTVIEDGAEAHGAEYAGEVVGGIGDVGCFSFYANKIITTGEGGMVVTDDDDIAERARLLRNLAFHPERRFRHDHVGFNYRMTNLQAAIGVGQLGKLDRFVARKRAIASRYDAHFDDEPYLVTPVEREWAKNVYWMYGVLVDEAAPLSRDELQQELAEEGIETRTFFLRMSDQRAFTDLGLFANTETPVARELSECGLYLPSGVGITDEEIDEVATTVRRLLRA